MTLRTRLALGLVAIALVLLAPLGVALRSLERLHDTTAELRNGEFAASLVLGRMRSSIDDLRRSEDALLFVHDSSSRERMAASIAQLSSMSDTLARFHLDTASTEVHAALQRVADAAPGEYAKALTGAGAAAESISTRDVRPAIKDAEHSLAVAEGDLRRRTQERVADASDETTTAQHASALALALALLLALVIAIWLTRSISTPVQDLQAGMEIVADGDFSYQLSTPASRGDEFGRLAESFASMTRQLTALDKLKAEFISIASHELKTPINVMLGYLELLRDGMYGTLTPKQGEVVATLGNQGHLLARLVKQLLDIGRFQAVDGKIDPRAIDFRGFLAELESAFHVLARQREIHFTIAADPDVPAEVVWDADRMNEVLGNLLANAFKFTPQRGTVELLVHAADSIVRMRVCDTGAGIAPAQLPHIFEKFYQADNQDSASAGGTGLGLAIAKDIVAAHHGTISVASTPGKGTTFEIVLPARVVEPRRSAGHRISTHG